MALNNPLLPSACQCSPDVGTDVGLRHPAVQNIDPCLLAAVYDGFNLICIMAFQPFSSQSDFTDHQSGFSQFSVVHMYFPSFIPVLRDCNPAWIQACSPGTPYSFASSSSSVVFNTVILHFLIWDSSNTDSQQVLRPYLIQIRDLISWR